MIPVRQPGLSRRPAASGVGCTRARICALLLLSVTGLIIGLAPAPAFARDLPAAAASGENAANQTGAIERALTGVVSVFPQWPTDIRRSAEPEASAVALSDGRLFVTAAHVVAKALSVQLRTADGQILPARLVAHDLASDLAILRIDEEPVSLGIVAMPVADDAPALGETACAIGNAFGLDLSVTCGVVSALHKTGTGFNKVEDFVQTDAAVNPGASGGALVNRNGELIGILSAIFTKRSDANIGVNFAVSIALMRRVVSDLDRQGKVDYPDTGMTLTPRLLSSFGGQTGAFVMEVEPGSSSEQAGLRIGHVIVEAAGRRIRKPEDLDGLIASVQPPAIIEIEAIDHKSLAVSTHRLMLRATASPAAKEKETTP